MRRSFQTLFSTGRGAVLPVLAAAFALRLWDIRARSLWFDEAGEFWIATAPIGRLAHAVQTGTGDPPLFSFLLHLWMKAGTDLVWLRLLSVVCSMLGVAGVMRFAHRLGGWKAAIAAGSLMAVLPPDIRYAQEVGQYALMVGAVAWNLVALHRLASAPSRREAFVWAATALVASYAYYGAVIAVTVPFGCVVVEHAARRDRVRVRVDAIAAGAYAAGVVPLVLFLRAQFARVLAGDVSSAGPGGVLDGGVGALWTWVCQVLAFQFTGWPYTRVPAVLPVLLALGLIVVAARSRRRIAVWFAAVWLASTIADIAGLFPYGFRWGLVMTPLLVALVAAGFALARGRVATIAAAVALAGLVAGAVTSLPNRSARHWLHPRTAWPWPETEDMGTVMAYWREQRRPTQPTYVYYGAAPAFAYYARGDLARGLPATWYLECWHGNAGYCSENNVYYGKWLRSFNETQRLDSVFRSLGGRPAEFWIVFAHMQPNDDRDLVASIVQSGYRIESVYQATGAALFRLSR